MNQIATNTHAHRDNTLTEIAREKLGVKTLEIRGRDGLDFYDISVASLRQALLAAYEAGKNHNVDSETATCTHPRANDPDHALDDPSHEDGTLLCRDCGAPL